MFAGALELMPPQVNADFEQRRRLGRRHPPAGGAGQRRHRPRTRRKAREFGAEGIGLCRTEHMFMDESRLPAVRRMILADDEHEREAALAEILPMQQADFEEILTAMDGLPVTIRLLDPPLHEFLPSLLDQALEVQRLQLAGADAERAARAETAARADQEAHRAEPDAGHPRRAAGPAVPRDPADAGAGHRPGRARRRGRRGRPAGRRS